ncbi:MAG TPA: response regulator, partial [Mucilaginibacter sp.]|nr:response regulator [Mucilaginibacter sp.]
MKILIIEDDKDTLEVLGFLAGELKLDVVSKTAILSLSEIKTIAPNLILTDHWIGNKFGSDLCRAIKLDPYLHHIPVILLSAQQNVQDLADKCHADAFLAKPFDINE